MRLHETSGNKYNKVFAEGICARAKRVLENAVSP
jgi:hypothetical protein